LEPLNEAQTRDLVERLTAGLHEAIRERIVERSGGNPFFAIELVRGLAEHGITGKATVADTLPDTVHAAVLARLDLLSPQERAVVQAAAVAGRSFRPELLYAVLDDRTPTQIDAALDALLTDNLLIPVSGGAFTFRHVLIRDVAHGMLSRAERVRMYSKIAAWLEASRRRLSIPELPAMERGDALNMMAQLYFHLGNYSRCDDIVREALAQLRPGEPVGYLAGAVALAMRALYLTGRWSEIDALIPTLEDVWEQVQHDVSTATDVAYGYFTVLDMALAREDQARASTAASVLQRCLPSGQANARNGCSLLAALLEDDPRRIDYDPSNGDWGTNLLMFENEHGVNAPPALIAQEHYWLSWGSSVLRGRCVEIAEALEASDMTRLAAAIDGAEVDGLITHTARMRVVLAQRMNDRAQLERARSVLEGLGDRRFLRRLDEIALTLDKKGKVR